MSRGLVYHAGGLGDFVLSIPAILRVAAAFEVDAWHYWGPADRLALLPGFLPPPPDLLRAGHTLWGDSPDAGAAAFLAGCGVLLAFGGREPPAWPASVPGSGNGTRLLLSAFPARGAVRVPAHQGRQLDVLGVPRLRGPCLPGWRRAVLPGRVPEEVLLHPGSGDPRKNLPASTWSAVLARLRAKLGVPVRAVLGPVEAERGGTEEWLGAADRVSACGSVAELVTALSRARLFLGNDSGATHLAALLGVPTAVAFGPSDPGLWRPLGPAVRIVRTSAPCAPCTGGGPFDCREPGCLDAIAPEALAAAAVELAGSLRAP